MAKSSKQKAVLCEKNQNHKPIFGQKQLPKLKKK
jgi:hypothetical protein